MLECTKDRNLKQAYAVDGFSKAVKVVSRVECEKLCHLKATCAGLVYNRYQECYLKRAPLGRLIPDSSIHRTVACTPRNISLAGLDTFKLGVIARIPTRFRRTIGQQQHLTPPGRLWRYYSILPSSGTCTGAADLCAIFKNDVVETWVGAACSSDGGITFAEPMLIFRSTFASARMTHNLALAQHPDGSRWIAVGGQFRPKTERGAGDASEVEDTGVHISLSRSSSLCATAPCAPVWASPNPSMSPEQQWQQAQFLFNGLHPGCVERVHGATNAPGSGKIFEKLKREATAWLKTTRLGAGEHCEFDGRLSIVRHRDRWLLFARANTAHGVREVQFSRSDDLYSWSAFRPVIFQGLGKMPANSGIYFFGVQVNPLDNRSLVSIFPLVLNPAGGKKSNNFGGIAMAVSHDGYVCAQAGCVGSKRALDVLRRLFSPLLIRTLQHPRLPTLAFLALASTTAIALHPEGLPSTLTSTSLLIPSPPLYTSPCTHVHVHVHVLRAHSLQRPLVTPQDPD